MEHFTAIIKKKLEIRETWQIAAAMVVFCSGCCWLPVPDPWDGLHRM
jgi:hypothetical protein